MWRRPGTGPYVASPPGHALFEHAALLARCLAPYRGLGIELSTSWVRVFRSVRKVARRLPPELRRRVVGATSTAGWIRCGSGPCRVGRRSGATCAGGGTQHGSRSTTMTSAAGGLPGSPAAHRPRARHRRAGRCLRSCRRLAAMRCPEVGWP
ncbi:hypothetical protein [Paraburkholderia heleia]|uniref:hypothetical protein n=1 Tax=Paraburkholderia heleia TaxID=634127 RepID=UPI0038B8584C